MLAENDTFKTMMRPFSAVLRVERVLHVPASNPSACADWYQPGTGFELDRRRTGALAVQIIRNLLQTCETTCHSRRRQGHGRQRWGGDHLLSSA